MDARRTSTGTIPVSTSDIVAMIIRHEGTQYTNHPADRGGPTKFGITQRAWSQYIGRQATEDEIKNLTPEQAEGFYVDVHVHPFDRLGPTILRANVIDMGVNAGIGRAARLLQQTVGADVDGIIGPATAAAVASRDWNPMFVGVRLAFYERIIENNSSQLVFRRGWRARALSFYGAPHRLRIHTDGRPAFGHTGKAYL